jgi:hypothetical protein
MYDAFSFTLASWPPTTSLSHVTSPKPMSANSSRKMYTMGCLSQWRISIRVSRHVMQQRFWRSR